MSGPVSTQVLFHHETRPSMQDRTFSTPPVSPPSIQYHRKTSYPRNSAFAGSALLTPPTSPRLTRSSTDLAGIVNESQDQPDRNWLPDLKIDDTTLRQIRSRSLSDPSRAKGVFECPFDIEITKDHHGRDQKYGTGAWSTVYRAIARVKRNRQSSLPTPPSSPAISVPVLVAVKKPSRRSAVPIIKAEGMVLSELASIDGYETYVVPFHGMISSLDSLVLSPVPLSLEEHIRRCATTAHNQHSNLAMSQPCIGSEKIWLTLASQTVSGLAWLHSDAGVIHGDIKPGNFLLSPCLDAFQESFPFKVLYADFSSGQLVDSPEPTHGTLSAVTREYTAPELLSSKVLNDPTSTATTATDVFSLAVTLLVAATGELMVYPGSVWQRQAMAIQGWLILSNVRNSDQSLRLPKFGTVDQVLERAVLKADLGRIDAISWKRLVDAKVLGEPTKNS